MKVLEKFIVKNEEALAETFRRNSDNAEVAYANDLADIANSGSYNDLSDVPSEFTPEEHGDTYHSVNYENLSNKGSADGYAPLDFDSQVPDVHLPDMDLEEHDNEYHTEDFVDGETKPYTLVYGDTPSGDGYINFIPEEG